MTPAVRNALMTIRSYASLKTPSENPVDKTNGEKSTHAPRVHTYMTTINQLVVDFGLMMKWAFVDDEGRKLHHLTSSHRLRSLGSQALTSSELIELHHLLPPCCRSRSR
jgi:hypothetical protein